MSPAPEPGPPEEHPFEIPEPVRNLARGLRPVPVWRNDDGVVTCALYPESNVHHEGTLRPSLYIKWAATGVRACLQDEADRLSWAAPYTPVPAVVDVGADEAGGWLLTRAIDAHNAVSERWRADPATATRAVGEGLRALHESMPVYTCPFSWSVASRRQRARAIFDSGHTYPPSNFKEDREGLSPAEALRRLDDDPPPDRLVVCHGDPCCPNTLLDGTGNWCAHVDFDLMGVADRWADIAVASWSCEWNYGPEWGRVLMEAYGVEPDAERTRYYRLLWDMA